ncbi:hypothetical protein E4U42_006369 [Claviceps africana]|uniref:Uncharacterized protein n=1 Tax=Claviceps africana TaxID=83212 RepID=A0A8K0JB69_9HYPO|nr:hypothetical protein E4U42_006369 [Claviceps africana]
MDDPDRAIEAEGRRRAEKKVSTSGAACGADQCCSVAESWSFGRMPESRLSWAHDAFDDRHVNGMMDLFCAPREQAHGYHKLQGTTNMAWERLQVGRDRRT